ncbi:MAG: MFS transporter [Actinomycetes bacterium]
MTTTDALATTRGWKPWYGLWGFLMVGWTVSAADRALTGPVMTWMIDNKVSFIAEAENPHALAGLVGGLFFAGYMLTQFPGGYLGDRYGHRTLILVSLFWAGIATILTGLFAGLLMFVALRVITGLGEGAYYSNDRSVIAEVTPERQRSTGMGVVITGLAIGITIAVVGTPYMVEVGAALLSGAEAWRMPFWILGTATLLAAAACWLRFRKDEEELQVGKATVHLLGYSAVSFFAVMAVYMLATQAGIGELWTAVVEVALALVLVLFALTRKGEELRPVLKHRDLFLLYLAGIPILWNLWFFSFWSVAIVGEAANSSFLEAALVAGFNAGAGILGFPVGGWLSDLGMRRGWGRKPMLLSFTAAQALITFGFAYYQSTTGPNVWTMAALLFFASLFFNALQPIWHALAADIAEPSQRGSAFGMMNLISEIGAVLSPAVSGVMRDATGAWTSALYLDAALVVAGLVLFALVREMRGAGTGAAMHGAVPAAARDR